MMDLERLRFSETFQNSYGDSSVNVVFDHDEGESLFTLTSMETNDDIVMDFKQLRELMEFTDEIKNTLKIYNANIS